MNAFTAALAVAVVLLAGTVAALSYGNRRSRRTAVVADKQHRVEPLPPHVRPQEREMDRKIVDIHEGIESRRARHREVMDQMAAIRTGGTAHARERDIPHAVDRRVQ